MSELTARLIKTAFQEIDLNRKKVSVDRTEIRQLCASYLQLYKGDFLALHNQINEAYVILLCNQETFESIQEAWDWEGDAVAIIENNHIGSYAEIESMLETVKKLDAVAANQSQTFKVDVNLIIDICLSHDEAESNNLENLKHSVLAHEKSIQNHKKTFMEIKNIVDEFSESRNFVDNALEFLQSKNR